MNSDRDVIIGEDFLVNEEFNEETEGVSKDQDETETHEKKTCCNVCRKLTVEPLVLLYGIALYPLMPVTQQVQIYASKDRNVCVYACLENFSNLIKWCSCSQLSTFMVYFYISEAKLLWISGSVTQYAVKLLNADLNNLHVTRFLMIQ